MKLTILQVGETPKPMRDRYERFEPLFENMFMQAGADFTFETIAIVDGAAFPDVEALEGVIITGSAAGVYDHTPWIDPLRQFIRAAYEASTPMLGVCFGHQIMADALGGDVRKSDKGWGIGRHIYRHTAISPLLSDLPAEVAIAASHQDQVITPPAIAEVYLSSEFTPNAGLIYENGAAISMQPHPEFDRAYTEGLIELRRNNPLDDATVDAHLSDQDAPTDRLAVARSLAQFLKQARP